MHQSARICLLGFFTKKIVSTLQSPKFPNIAHYESRFSLKTRMPLALAPQKCAVKYETAHENFKFWVKNLTGSRILAVSAHAY